MWSLHHLPFQWSIFIPQNNIQTPLKVTILSIHNVVLHDLGCCLVSLISLHLRVYTYQWQYIIRSYLKWIQPSSPISTNLVIGIHGNLTIWFFCMCVKAFFGETIQFFIFYFFLFFLVSFFFFYFYFDLLSCTLW